MLEDLPELAYIRSDELRRKAIEAWAYALAETDFPRVAAIPGEATPGVFAHPTTLAYGSATGVILHLAGEMLKNMAGFEMLHVPYSGNGPALTDVLGGRLQVMVDAVSNSAPYIADGKLRPLVVPSRQRTPLLPDVPSSAEAGLPNYQVETWFALYGPAAMPDGVVAKINAALNAVLQEPDAVGQFTKVGLDPRPTSPAQAAALLKTELDKWGDVVRRIGLQVE